MFEGCYGLCRPSRFFRPNSSWTTQTIAGPNFRVGSSSALASFRHEGPSRVCTNDKPRRVSPRQKKMGESGDPASKLAALLKLIKHRTARPLLYISAASCSGCRRCDTANDVDCQTNGLIYPVEREAASGKTGYGRQRHGGSPSVTIDNLEHQ
jgi:hypothetical protein